MRVRSLDPVGHPDFNDVVVHFTGRRSSAAVAPEVDELDDWGRLRRIVEERRLRGFAMPGTGALAICLTEATAAGCSWLIKTDRYSSCGLAFTKQFLFKRGGGPVLQVRGDEWHEVRRWPDRLRARAVRLWPGALADPGEALPWRMEGRSEWLYEREWRVPDDGDGLRFGLEDIAFLVLPSVGHLHQWVRDVHRADPELARSLASTRYVVLGPDGIDVANGVAARRAGGGMAPSR